MNKNLKKENRVYLQFMFTTVVMWCFIPTSSFAGIETLIKNVFPKGTMSNVTSSSIVHEQAAGHCMGGSVIIKTPPTPGLHLLQVQPPSCKLGGLPCGVNFELIGGGISIINKKELINQLKSLPQAAGMYAAKMAIKTYCPQCHDIQEWLDAKADMMNQMANADCKDMQNMMDGLLSKTWSKERGSRQANTALRGGGQDLADLQNNSKNENNEEKDSALESQLGDNYNLVWKALNKKRKITGDDSGVIREMLMSISGTIIGHKEVTGIKSAKRSIRHLKSLVNKELIKEFIGNGSNSSNVELYVCDDKENCLKPTKKSSSLTSNALLFNQVQKLLKTITDKIDKNIGTLTDDEASLVALSSVPLIAKIEMDLATYSNKNNVISNQAEFVEALCFDVVTSYFQSLLMEVEEAVGEFEHSQLADSKIFDKFAEECRETMRILSMYRIEAFKRYDIITQTKERLRKDQQNFDNQFGSYMQNHNK
ncbi:MAG: hypothetical protein DGJ47_000944 [Rickettsiaceae bacterium]